MDQTIRNKLRGVVTQCRKLLEDSTAQALQGRFGIYAARKKGEVQIEDEARMAHLAEEDRACRQDLLDHLEHIQAIGYKPSEALEQLVREISFTHLNRLCAYKMMESRGLIREAVSRGLKSQGFFFYLADHPEDEKLHNGGGQETAYRNFLNWLGGTLSQEIGVLFNPNDPANRIYPPQRVLDEVLALINDGDLKNIWSQDETIGWVYQYFTPKELRDKARKESQAPRNSYELAFRNQFFTPRYVVELLTDNTLGRIWYEMRKGKTILKDRCKYLVRRPTELFLKDGEQPPAESKEAREDLSQEDLLKQPVYVPHRRKKDPRELKALDPACGSGHFLLYCFDLLQTIYEEAYDDPDLGAALRSNYPALEDLRRAVPGLILKHNLHGIDIDLRATQIAALALWLRCQRTYQELGLKNWERPKITRSNIVCAEPMPGETDLLKEFTATLQPKVLGQLVEAVFEKMKLAGEAGSLLKIEEEIREAAASAKKEYQEELRRRKEQAGFLPGMAPPRERTLFDFSDMTDSDFLDRVEEEIVAALGRYAEKASNGRGFRRLLFAEDAARGFSFVDVCSKKYDVVLMNPPFGATSTRGKPYLDNTYKSSKADLYAMFIDRAIQLSPMGMCGAITNRTGFFLDSLTEWRERVVMGERRIDVFADLGDRVLDALVEAAAYTIQARLYHAPSVFFRLLGSEDKESDLLTLIETLNREECHRDTYYRLAKMFEAFPASRMSYWTSERALRWFRELGGFNTQSVPVKFGLSTKDDFRFLRLAWEVTPGTIVHDRYTATWDRPWMFLAKGGEYAPFIGDIHLLAHWANEGEAIAAHVAEKYPYLANNVSWVLHPEVPYGRPGITFTRRTTSGFSPRALPAGCLISDSGATLYPDDEKQLPEVQSLCMSRVFGYLLELSVASGDSVHAGSAARTYEIGIVGRIPVPKVSVLPSDINGQVKKIWQLLYQIESQREGSRYFDGLASQHLPSKPSIRDTAIICQIHNWEAIVSATELACLIDNQVRKVYGIDVQTQQLIEMEFGKDVTSYPDAGEDHRSSIERLWKMNVSQLQSELANRQGFARFVTKQTYFVDQKIDIICHIAGANPRSLLSMIDHDDLANDAVSSLVIDIIGLSIGTTFGRWDIRFSTSERQLPELPDPFDPLPVCPPGMLQGPDGLPAKPESVPSDYPIRIDWDGILVDDPGHYDDIIRRVQDVIELIWKDRAEAIEREACEILGVEELRDYFRKPGNGGFWMDHVKRYSKSRRKAPIYWYLRSAKGNYGLWLYYHRLDKDILFKALLNYVEPKIRLEEDRLKSLRGRKEAAGSSGREAKQIEKDMDRQEQFVSEMRDFEERLRRVANLHLNFDLNGGVILNIAPFWELVPWNEPKKYWSELEEGKYDWSHVAYQIWPERVQEACKKNRSIAIAHGRENLCEVQQANTGKRTRRRK
jgi:hypothetical protein